MNCKQAKLEITVVVDEVIIIYRQVNCDINCFLNAGFDKFLENLIKLNMLETGTTEFFDKHNFLDLNDVCFSSLIGN